jgi:hypothetical protein
MACTKSGRSYRILTGLETSSLNFSTVQAHARLAEAFAMDPRKATTNPNLAMNTGQRISAQRIETSNQEGVM